MNSINVLKNFDSSINETALASFPAHICEKMIVDLVNGIQIVNDHIKVSKSKAGKIERFMESINGTGKIRQDLINQNLAKGLESTSNWLQYHDSKIASVNMAIGKIGVKLLETRNGVMALKNKQHEIVQSISHLEFVVEKKCQELSEYIKDVDYRTRAASQLEREFAKLKAGKLAHLPPFLRLYTVLDNLKNNDFGFFLSYGKDDKDKSDLAEHLENLALINLAEDIATSREDLNEKKYRFVIDDMSTSLKGVNKSTLSSINFLSDWSNKEQHSSTWLVHQLTKSVLEKSPLSHTSLPKTVRIDRWCKRLNHENIVTNCVRKT